MRTPIHFSDEDIERLIRGNDDELRAILADPKRDEVIHSYARLGLAVIPGFIRWELEEANRHRPLSVTLPALEALVAWLLADCVFNHQLSPVERIEAVRDSTKSIAAVAIENLRRGKVTTVIHSTQGGNA